MNKYAPYAGIPVAAALSYIVVFTVQPIYVAIVVGIPLMFLSRKLSGIAGFLVGLIVPLTVLFSYPISSVMQLSSIVGELTGMPSVLILVIYPLMYGIIAAISALLFTGIREMAFKTS